MTAAVPRIVPPTPEAVAEAGRLLRAGRLVAIPTETVYGLAADATSDLAVAALFEAKARPRFNPLIIHYPDTDAARVDAVFDDRAERLAAAFWPGPLTLVLPRRPGSAVSLLAGAGLDTLGVRVPGHAVARAVLAAAERAVALPSANRSGEVSPTTAAHVARSLGSRAALILDGGPSLVGIESTVVELGATGGAILRPGRIEREAVEAVIGRLSAPGTEPPRAPGGLSSRDAAGVPLRLDADSVRPGEALLSFGPHRLTGFAAERNLSPRGDLVEAAANLFAMLRALDDPGHVAIAVMAIPDRGLGIAINDRLRRAAAPRPRHRTSLGAGRALG